MGRAVVLINLTRTLRIAGAMAVVSLLAACGGNGGDEQATSAAISAVDSAALAANAARWVDSELQPTTLSREAQLAELAWFTRAAEPFRGMTINVVSETLTTHEYESTTLAKAFFDITGIKVNHDLIQEGDVIEKLQTQM